jgi:hypothetical protein
MKGANLRNQGFNAHVEVVSRRSVARTMLGGGLTVALLATVGRADGLAQATPVAAGTAPSRYVLTSGDIEIVYVPAVSGAEARLDYRDASASVTFAGDDLSIENSRALGRFVSVGLEYVADGYDRYLTLLVPDVNPDESGRDVPISTVAIVTKHLTSIGGPALVEGALQTYEAVELEGVAEFSTA